MPRRFVDKTVVITGASTGIGAACARRFAEEGANVVLAARGRAALEAVADEIGPRALAVPTDVAELDACRRLLTRAVERFGAVHVLVNNAGKNVRGHAEGIDAAELASIVDVNLRAPIFLTRLTLPLLRAAGGGAIVNVASLAGYFPFAEEATYSATKFGLRAFTHALADELRGTGITASAVSPGPVDTNFIGGIDDVPDIAFSQPMSTDMEIAALVLDCAADGKVERARPASGALLATLAYLAPSLRRATRPLLEKRGRRNKARFRAAREP
ncbi:MAG: SDR family oxidoreductase [Myxococcales bacterium]|nr:SDR family oxidoreductase [Myxococcales bacterium]